ncbi:unnamed protein product, partial [Meganyctiphanes norvegica]
DGSDSESNSSKEESDDENEGGLQLFSGALEVKTISKPKKKKKKKSKQKLIDLHQEKINQFRNQNGIKAWGGDVPDPIDTFEKLITDYNVKEILINNLKTQGFKNPTPIQMQAWPLMLKNRELLGCAPTGSGKTAAFLLPVLHQLGGPQKRGFRAVIVSPTRELATQIHRECVRLCEGYGIRAHLISNVNKAREKFGPQSGQKFDILVTTPNRLVYLLKESSEGGKPISLENVEWLIIDESDRLFEAGEHGFRDQLATIYSACTSPKIHRALFSATFAHEVEHWCKLNLNNVAMVSVGIRNTASQNVKQELVFCGDESGKLIALRDFIRKGYEPPVLIFVQTKERAKELFKELIYDNLMVDVIHADRTQTQRDNVVKAFRERKIWILISTELMARGIDFKGVNVVINYDFPPSTISYIHRVGRTGRANHHGHAITFWTIQDKPALRSVAVVIHESKQEVPQWMLEMKKLKKSEKKLLAKKQPRRNNVSQAVLKEKIARKRKKDMIQGSKRRAKKTKVDQNDA